MNDPSEFESIDEHLFDEEDLDELQSLEDIEQSLDEDFIRVEDTGHSSLWEDLSEINEDDIPW